MPPVHLDIPRSEHVDPEAGLLLAMLDAGTRKWRRELGRVSRATIAWQPFPEGHSIGALLLHMADVEAYWLHEVLGGQPLPEELKAALLSEATQQYAVRWPSPPRKPLAWFYAQQDAVREESRAVISRTSGADYVARLGGNEFTLPWLVHHVVTHEAYHGGQAVLLSLMAKRVK